MISHEATQELARKHQVEFDQVRHCAMQVNAWYRHVVGWSDEEILANIEAERKDGHYHISSLIWFIHIAHKNQLGEYAIIDMHVALGHGER